MERFFSQAVTQPTALRLWRNNATTICTTIFTSILLHLYFIYLAVFAFIALTLLVWHQEEHQASKNCDEELVWLSVSSEVQAVCIWSSRCHCMPEPHHLLPHLNPGWFYLSGTGLPRLSCINALHHYILLKMYNLNYLKL